MGIEETVEVAWQRMQLDGGLGWMLETSNWSPGRRQVGGKAMTRSGGGSGVKGRVEVERVGAVKTRGRK